jgi:hypothetical protein
MKKPSSLKNLTEVTVKTIEEAMALAESFFGLPLEVKGKSQRLNTIYYRVVGDENSFVSVDDDMVICFFFGESKYNGETIHIWVN